MSDERVTCGSSQQSLVNYRGKYGLSIRAEGKVIMRCARLLLVFSVFSLLICVARAEPAQPSRISPPPLGWSSWNSFSNTIDARVVMEQARAMLSSGLHRAGYEYVNIDEGWWLGQRDADGNIVVDPKAWPALAPGERAGDMTNIVRYIHGLGLKAGIYTDAGAGGCSMFPDLGPKYLHAGSEGHYDQDFLQFAKWGFDYVKVDWCGGNQENLDPAVEYAEIARAIERAEKLTGHPMYFSICEWGKNSPWTWAPHIGGIDADIWRTSGDIVAPIVANGPHANRKASFARMISNFEQGIHPEAEHTGFYNDPDMLVAGMPGLSAEQNRVHMALWAISGAPLIAGADLATLDDATRKTLTNPAMLAIDQDPLGLQATEAAQPKTGLEVWSKRLAAPGERAVVLLNRTGAAARIQVRWEDLGLAASASAQVTDVWTGKSLGAVQSGYATEIPANDAMFLRIRGKEARMTRYPAFSSAPHADAREAQGIPVGKSAPLRFSAVTARHNWAAIAITYTNPDASPRYAMLRVNGQTGTWIEFPPTGSRARVVWIQAMLDHSPDGNVLTFSAGCAPGPRIASIDVQ